MRCGQGVASSPDLVGVGRMGTGGASRLGRAARRTQGIFFDPHIGEDEHKVHLGGAQGEGLPRRLPVRLAGSVFKPNHSWKTHGLDDIWLIFE